MNLRLSLCVAFLASIIPAAFAFGTPDPGFTPTPLFDRCSRIDTMSVAGDGSAIYSVSDADSRKIIARLRADGMLDSEWSQAGTYEVPTSDDYVSVDLLVPDHEGATLVVISGYLGSRVMKLDRQGRRVSAYGTGQGVSDFAPFPSTGAAVVQPDGALVIQAGWGVHSRWTTWARFTASGRLDPTFGEGGVLSIPFPPERVVYAWGVRPEGGIEFAYYTWNENVGAARLGFYPPPADSPGSLGFVPRLVPRSIVAGWMHPAAKIQPDGGLLLGLEVVRRYTPSGQLDTSFGNGGKAALARGYARALFLGSEGGITVFAYDEQRAGGFQLPSHIGMHVTRLLADGRQDAEFPNGYDLGGWQFNKWSYLADGKIVADPLAGDCRMLRLLGDTPRAEAVLVEYYHPQLDRYFMTQEGPESALLDRNVDEPGWGWRRTGHTFGAWLNVGVPGAVPVCRFYGDILAGPNSHFFTSESFECELLRELEARTPVGRPAWRLEGQYFSVAPARDGACAPNLQPIMRLYNRGFEGDGVPNHRYTADASVYRNMQDRGWVGEGVRFCVPPSIGNGNFSS